MLQMFSAGIRSFSGKLGADLGCLLNQRHTCAKDSSLFFTKVSTASIIIGFPTILYHWGRNRSKAEKEKVSEHMQNFPEQQWLFVLLPCI